MQRRIQSLPVQLANQIAAGEVVARPASVVKELLENSIDAGADQIELELEHGGIRLIKVLDNGRGIHRDDMKLALAPHATSKVYSQQELEQILSLGFRGEALASIASVSRFKLSSRMEDAEQGWELEAGGKEPIPSPLPRGTLVEVRDLFHNTPARRKFLRSERTEFLHIEEVVKNLALSRFDIAFTLLHNGRQVLRLRQAEGEVQQGRRVGEILGKGFLREALQLGFEAAGMRLWGWLARPDASRSQSDKQFFYLNGRMVRDKLINHAVRLAHQAVLEPGRHPAYALYLEVDPRGVDVNVHPVHQRCGIGGALYDYLRVARPAWYMILSTVPWQTPLPRSMRRTPKRRRGGRDGKWTCPAATPRPLAEVLSRNSGNSTVRLQRLRRLLLRRPVNPYLAKHEPSCIVPTCLSMSPLSREYWICRRHVALCCSAALSKCTRAERCAVNRY